MLQLKEVVKTYATEALTQTALKGVSIRFRNSEFVSILGPSGSGKTTLLNIIGGLDRYTRGDLLINGVSTRDYRDRDWDAYRNRSIGFVFQSYHLIPHQSVLSNVELALTLAGVSRKERRARAEAVLEQVGLGDHIHKKPNQLSGGQMQRVAIARALINNPEILLADEPTGALDSETSVQVMDLLKEIAREKLVIMVTHNPELAEAYSTRIVRLLDGEIVSDSDPYDGGEGDTVPEEREAAKVSMSFWTALSLSLQNLRTKKGRTILTAFAGRRKAAMAPTGSTRAAMPDAPWSGRLCSCRTMTWPGSNSGWSRGRKPPSERGPAPFSMGTAPLCVCIGRPKTECSR